MKLSEQIKELLEDKDFSQAALDDIAGWQKDALKLDALEDLKESGASEGLKIIMEDFKKSVAIINNALVVDDKFLNKEGIELYKKREWLKEFLLLIDFKDDYREGMQEDIDSAKASEI